MRHSGQVINFVWINCPKQSPHRLCVHDIFTKYPGVLLVCQIRGVVSGMREPYYFSSIILCKKVGEMAPHKAADSGDQYSLHSLTAKTAKYAKAKNDFTWRSLRPLRFKSSTDALAPVIEDIGNCLFERNLRFPTRRLLKFGAISFQQRNVGGPQTQRVGPDFDLQLCCRKDHIQQF